MELPFVEQKVQRLYDFDTVHVADEVAVHGNHDLLVIVLHSLQRRKLLCAGFGCVHVVGDLDILFLVVFIVVMFGMMFWQSKKAKQQQAERQDFRSSLQPGTEVITIGGIIGKVVSVDTEYEEIVVDSEGSQLRFGFNAISREYVRPAYVHDDEVDENGNPLSKEDEPDQKPIVDATEEPAQDADVIQQPIDEQKNN